MKIQQSIEIDRPVDVVFAYVTDIDRQSEWESSSQESRKTSEGPTGVGTTSAGVSKFLGRRIEWTGEVTEYDPPRKATIKSTGGSLPYTGTYVCEPLGPSRTRLTATVDADLSGLFKLAEPLLERAARGQAENSLNTLKLLLEAEGQGAPA